MVGEPTGGSPRRPPGSSGEPPAWGALDPGAPSPFGRHSLVRAVVAEPATALLVQRALVMEVAHAKVAAGVEHHSGFRRHPYRRVWVTADAAVRLVFGDPGVAHGALRQIYRTHDRINGTLGEAGGPWPAGAMYSAHDASLLLWVWATLVDTARTAFTRWVRPFTAQDAARYYAEMRSFAVFLGIPEALVPADPAAFASYVDAMVRDGLGTNDASRSLARQILWFRHWSVPPAAVRVERALALATLPPGLAERLGIHPDPGEEHFAARLDAWMVDWYRRLPRMRTWLAPGYVVLRRPTIGIAGTIPWLPGLGRVLAPR